MHAGDDSSHEHAAPVSGRAATFDAHGVAAARGTSGAGRGLRVGIAVARFNQRITEALYTGTVGVLLDAGVEVGHIEAVQVPGAMELPLALRELAETGRFQALVALGCVIRGETSHFDYVCSVATDGALQVQLATGIPVGVGVITCDTLDQALARSAPARASGGGHNVGSHAAYAALEMATLVRDIRAR
jgi:6,7-dimethyl-8-ribityllumazine synthase